MLKVIFASLRPNDKRGSYRIWIRDAAAALAGIGVETSIITPADIAALEGFEGLLLLDKGVIEAITLPAARRFRVGAINPGWGRTAADFAIVGSIEEQVALAPFYERSFFWPLIERGFEDVEPRCHREQGQLTLCYHGNVGHLGAMASLGLTAALEAFHAELGAMGKGLLLKIITGEARPRWVLGRPKVPTRFIQYDLATIADEIRSSDIGLVPNAHRSAPSRWSTWLGGRIFGLDVSRRDFALRFKSKSNYGRALVFQQLGVPVIADMTPSHFDLIQYGETGFLAGNTASWLSALRALVDPGLRTRIADAAWQQTRERHRTNLVAKRFVDFVATLDRPQALLSTAL